MLVCVSFSAFSATEPVNATDQIESWATEQNRNIFVNKLVGENGDLVEFQAEFQNQIVRDYVPIEARVGISLRRS